MVCTTCACVFWDTLNVAFLMSDSLCRAHVQPLKNFLKKFPSGGLNCPKVGELVFSRMGQMEFHEHLHGGLMLATVESKDAGTT